jgi:hypothetical protein
MHAFAHVRAAGTPLGKPRTHHRDQCRRFGIEPLGNRWILHQRARKAQEFGHEGFPNDATTQPQPSGVTVTLSRL